MFKYLNHFVCSEKFHNKIANGKNVKKNESNFNLELFEMQFK